MKALYQIIGISKQALHQYNDRQVKRQYQEEMLKEQATAIRERHPRIGCRTLYWMMEDIAMGRDRCEQILLANGFKVRRVTNYFKTTVAQYIYRFPNLIKGLTDRKSVV